MEKIKKLIVTLIVCVFVTGCSSDEGTTALSEVSIETSSTTDAAGENLCYWLITDKKSGITTDSEGWTTDSSYNGKGWSYAPTKELPYVWCYCMTDGEVTVGPYIMYEYKEGTETAEITTESGGSSNTEEVISEDTTESVKPQNTTESQKPQSTTESSGGNYSTESTTEKPAESTTEATTQEYVCSHNWVEETKQVYHEEVGHFESVEIAPEFTYDVYDVRCKCTACGMVDVNREGATGTGGFICPSCGVSGNWSSVQVCVGTKTEPALYEEQWVIDAEAYWETVGTGVYKCTICGATK